MNSIQPNNSITFRSISNKIADLNNIWSSRAAYGSLSAAEIFSPNYRRTAAEQILLSPAELYEKTVELHNFRQRIISATSESFELADKVSSDTKTLLSNQNTPTEMQKLQVVGLFSNLDIFIKKMEQAETSIRESATIRTDVLEKARGNIRSFAGSKIEEETEIDLLSQREETMNYLFEPECIEASLQNNSLMLEKMKTILTEVEKYSKVHNIKLTN